jgi:hypothetical protein
MQGKSGCFWVRVQSSCGQNPIPVWPRSPAVRFLRPKGSKRKAATRRVGWAGGLAGGAPCAAARETGPTRWRSSLPGYRFIVFAAAADERRMTNRPSRSKRSASTESAGQQPRRGLWFAPQTIEQMNQQRLTAEQAAAARGETKASSAPAAAPFVAKPEAQ